MALLVVSQRKDDINIKNTIITRNSGRWFNYGEKPMSLSALRFLKIKIRNDFGWKENEEVNIINIIPLADE